MNNHVDSLKSNCLVSVIIPVYNAEETIATALNSIINQTQGSFEIIVVNDGSTDNSIAEIYAFKVQNQHLRIMIVDKPHEGVSATRNTGLRIASGDYIAFLDADDEWHAEKTVKQLAVFTEIPDTDFIGCLYKPKANASLSTSKLKHVTSKDLMFSNIFQTSTVVMKRKVFEATGYFEKARLYGDERHYFLRVSTNFSCTLVNENLINYGNGKRGFGQSGLSKNIFKMEVDELQNLVYAYKYLNMSLFICCNAIAFSLAKFMRRLFIVYVTDVFKPRSYVKKL